MTSLQNDMNLALQHLMTGHLAEAERIYQQILQSDPNHPEAMTFLGIIAHQVGKSDIAVDLISKALAIKPDNPLALLNLGNAQKSLGKLSEAVDSYRKALSIKPDYVEGHNNLGVALKELGQLNAAVESYRKAIALKPDYAEAHNNLGNALKIMGMVKEAEESYHKAITLKPDFAAAYQNRAEVLKKLGHIDAAISCLQKALELAPHLSSARHNLCALQGATPNHAPREYVADLFDQYADRFETELLTSLEYDTPAQLKKTLFDLGYKQKQFATAVDLGCGTGLAGAALKDLAVTLIGIDVSKNMLRKAEAKGIYDRLILDDLVSGLKHLDDKIDLFVAADVFIYVGDLQTTFEAVRMSAAPNAVFAFSTEHIEGPDAFVLQESIRYAHAKAYIDALANQFGFQLAHFETIQLRKENGQSIAGGLYVLTCDAPSSE